MVQMKLQHVLTAGALLAGAVVNTILRQAPFNYNLNIVPRMQADPFLSSAPFIFLMNIFSNLFNPLACSGYILVFYLISNRKMQIIVFLLWFIFLSVALSFLKILFQQARPYWIAGSSVKMLEWICYTEYGCPSGHSMLGLLLLEFIIRFLLSGTSVRRGTRVALFTCAFILQACVIYSRMILGMHSLNQVLFGLMLGLASLVYYYSFAETALLKICLSITRRPNRKLSLFLNTLFLFFSVGLMFASLYLPKYQNDAYTGVIETFSRCKGFHLYTSFQYKCFIDMSLLMAGFGIIYGLVFIKNPQHLMQQTTYSKTSSQFVKRLLLTILISLLPAALFLNPLWRNIQMQNSLITLFLWSMQGLGLLFSAFFVVCLAPRACSRLGLQTYHRLSVPKQADFSNTIRIPSQQLPVFDPQ